MPKQTIRKSDLLFLSEFLAQLASDNETPSGSATPLSGRFWSRHDEGTFSLSPPEVELYDTMSRKLSADIYRDDDLSSEAIDSALVDAIFITLDLSSRRSPVLLDRIDEAIDHLVNFFNTAPQAFECWLPVDGLLESALPAKFGKSSFDTIGHEHFERVTSILGSSRGPHAEESISSFLPILTKDMEGKIAATVTTTARDDGAALFLARSEVEATLECLNFFVPTMPYSHSTLSLTKGHSNLGISHNTVIGTDGSVNHGSALTSMPGMYSIRELVAKHDAAGVAARRVDSLLLSDRRSKVGELLIRAVRWGGRAVSAESLEDKLLFFTIALECLGLPDGYSELSYRLAQRVARVIGTDIESRQSAFADVKRLYDMRSAIVHGGQKEVSEYDVATIHAIALSFVIHMLTDSEVSSMKTQEQLQQYFARITMA